MKRVFVGGIIMGRAPENMKHLELRGNDTVLRDALLVKINCSQNRSNGPVSARKSAQRQGFLLACATLQNRISRPPGFATLTTPCASDKSAP
jgi:hypothetical protein